jgi:hypothetical protein
MASPIFQHYERTIRRLYWLDFVNEQLEAVRRQQLRASLAHDPLPETAFTPGLNVSGAHVGSDEPEPPAIPASL